MIHIDLKKYQNMLDKVKLVLYTGKVSRVVGLTIESRGPGVNVGELCCIYTGKASTGVYAEVVGFKENMVILMPYGDMQGVGPGSLVVSEGKTMQVNVGNHLIGRIVDGLGNPMDDKELTEKGETYPVTNYPPHPLKRTRISQPMPLGVKAIDGLLSVGKGQRIGIFSGSGVGKSTLLGMVARNTRADINVIALIGERGREVREFIEKDLGEEGLKRSVIVAATSDQSALIRIKGAFLATSIAEYFRDKGMHVLLMMDSLTRFAMAQREVGLAIGEPPVSRGYTPSVFSMIPKLLERAGTSESGSITALYTVLVDGDDLMEPVTDTARGTLDGHIVLSRDLANRNRYPAIDILSSVSRVMPDIINKEHRELAGRIKEVMAIYKDAEDLINIGAYVKGSNEKIDYAIKSIDKINGFLRQGINESYTFEEVLDLMGKVLD